MKLRHTLTALVAGAAFALTACGNDAAPTGGTPANAGAMTNQAPVAGGSDATPQSDAGSGDTGDSTESDTTKSDTTESDTDASNDPAAGGACAGLVTLSNDFAEKILGKAATGGITQADVDAVFSEATVASIPDDLKSDVQKLKELSQQLVGKSATDSVSTLQEIGTVYQGLASKVTGGSCS